MADTPFDHLEANLDDKPRVAAPENQRASWVRWQVLGWLCSAATIAYICRQSIGVAESSIRESTGLDKTQMGFVMSAFFWSYALSQIPAGATGQALGSRRMLPLVSVAWSVATGAMALATGMFGLIATRVANGIAQAGIFPAAMSTLANWFPQNERGSAAGALGSFMGVGGAIGASLTGYLLLTYSWQSIFSFYTLLGIVWAVGFYLWFRDRPQEHSWVNAGELIRIQGDEAALSAKVGVPVKPEKSESTPWLGMFLSPAMWFICSQQFCRAAGQIFFASWFATFLQESRGLSIAEAGLLTSLPIMARIGGAVTGGMLSDAIYRMTGSTRIARQGVAGVSLLLCSGLVFASLVVENATGAVLLISLGALFASFAGASAYTITIDMGGKHTPTVFSTMNMFGNFGAASFPIVAAYISQVTGGWSAVLIMFGSLYVAAALFWFLLNPDRNIFEQSFWQTKEPSP